MRRTATSASSAAASSRASGFTNSRYGAVAPAEDDLLVDAVLTAAKSARG